MKHSNLWFLRYWLLILLVLPSISYALWSSPNTIDGTTTNALEPQMVRDSAGNAMVVFLQYQSGFTIVTVNRFDRFTGWGTSEALSTPGVMAESPRIACVGVNKFIVIYKQNDGSYDRIFSRIYDHNNSTWSTAETINYETTTNASSPEITSNGANKAMAIWKQSNGTFEKFYARVFDGVAWDFACHDIANATNAETVSPTWKPSISFKGSEAIVVFCQYHNVDNYHMYYNVWNGSSWGTAQAFDLHLSTTMGPSAVVHGSWNNAMIIYSENNAIYSAVYNGSSVETPILVRTSDASVNEVPQIAYKGNNKFITVYQQNNGLINKLYSSYNTVDVNNWSSPESIDDNNSSGNQKLVVDTLTNRIHVYFTENISGKNRLVRKSFDSLNWSAGELVDAGDFAVTGVSAVLQKHGTLLSFCQSDGSYNRIYERKEFTHKIWKNTSGDGLWNTSSNWEPVGVPQANDSVMFDFINASCSINGNIKVKSIFMSEAYTGILSLGNGIDTLDKIVVRNGQINFGTSKLYIVGDSADFSGVSSITMVPNSSSIEFIGSQPHIFKSNFNQQLPTIVQGGSGTTTAKSTFNAFKLTILQGLFDLGIDGAVFKDSVGSFSGQVTASLAGDALALGNKTLAIAGHADMATLDTIIAGSGSIELCGAGIHNFKPSTNSYYPRIFIQNTHIVVHNPIYSDSIAMWNSTFDFGPSFHHRIEGISAFNSNLLFNNCTLTVKGNVNSYGGGSISSQNAIMKLDPQSWPNQFITCANDTFPHIEIIGNFSTRLGGNTVCKSMKIQSGTLDLNGYDLTVIQDFTLTNGNNMSLEGLSSRNIKVFGNASLNGQSNSLLNLNPYSYWSMNVTGSFTISNANIGYCSAAGSTCTATSSNNLGQNFNFNFITPVRFWTGNNGVNFKDPLNWNPNGIPTIFDSLVFANTSNNCWLDTNISVGHVIFTSTYTGEFDFSVNQLGIRKNADFRTGGSFLNGNGSIKLEAYVNGKRNLIPLANTALPPIYTYSQTGVEDTVFVKLNGLNTSALHFERGVWDWGYGLHHQVGSIYNFMPSARMRFGSSEVKIVDTLALNCPTEFTPQAMIRFSNASGTQFIRGQFNLPKVVHDGASILRPYQDTLRCAGFLQNAGVLNLSEQTIKVSGNLDIRTSILSGLDGRVISVTGNANFNGTLSDTLILWPATQCTLQVNGLFQAIHSKINNIHVIAPEANAYSSIDGGLNYGIAFRNIKTWDGGGIDQNWSTAANWSDDVVPGSGDTVLFCDASNKNCILDVNTEVSCINLSSAYSGVFNFNDNTLTVNGNAIIQPLQAVVTGSLGTLIFNGVSTAQHFTSNQNQNFAKIEKTFGSNLFTHGIIVAGKLNIQNGSWYWEQFTDSKVNDSLVLGGNGKMFLNHSVLKINHLQTGPTGLIDFTGGTLIKEGSQSGLDLSGLDSINGNSGWIVFRDSTLSNPPILFNPVHNKKMPSIKVMNQNIQMGSHVWCDTLSLMQGSIDFGSSLNHRVQAIFANGNLNFNSCSLFVSSIGDFTFASVNPGNGILAFTQGFGGTRNLIPSQADTLPYVLINTLDTVVIQNRALHCTNLTILQGGLNFNYNNVKTEEFTILNGNYNTLKNLAQRSIQVGNNASLNGTPGNYLNLNPYTTWSIHAGGTISASYCTIGYSNAQASSAIATQSVDAMNNFGWIFPPTPRLWTGANGTSFKDSLNWNPVGAPSFQDSLIFSSGSNNCTLDSSFNVKYITFTNGYTGTFDFSYNNLTVYKNADFRTGGNITHNFGNLTFANSNHGRQILIPHPSIELPRITLNPPGGTNDTLLIQGHGLKTQSVFVNYGIWHWGNDSLNHQIGNIRNSMPSAKMVFGNSRVQITGDSLLLGCQIDKTPSSTLDFTRPSGMQYVKSWNTLPKIKHSGAGTLKAVTDILKCDGLLQMSGVLDLTERTLHAQGPVSIENSQIVGFQGKKIFVNGNLSLKGSLGDTINLTSAVQCTLEVNGTISAQYTKLYNVYAMTGNAYAISSLNSGNNIGWTFLTGKMWDGGGADNNWSTALNWTDDICPSASDTVIFSNLSSKNCELDLNTQIASIKFENSYTGAFSFTQGKLSVSKDARFESSGPVYPGSGILEFNGNFTSQTFAPKPGEHFGAIELNGISDVFVFGALKAYKVKINSGRWHWGTNSNDTIADTLQISNNAEMDLEQSRIYARNFVTNNGGKIDFDNGRIIKYGAGGKLNLSGIDSLVTRNGQIIIENDSTAYMPVTFTPSTFVRFAKLIVNYGILTFAGSGTIDTLENYGQINLGSYNHFVDIYNNYKRVHFNTCTLNVSRAINFFANTALYHENGLIRVNPNTNNLVTITNPPNDTLPAIQLLGANNIDIISHLLCKSILIDSSTVNVNYNNITTLGDFTIVNGHNNTMYNYGNTVMNIFGNASLHGGENSILQLNPYSNYTMNVRGNLTATNAEIGHCQSIGSAGQAVACIDAGNNTNWTFSPRQKYWVASSGMNSFKNPNNWNPVGVPTVMDSIIFTNNATSCLLDSSVTINSITIDPTYIGNFDFGSSILTVKGSADFRTGGSILGNAGMLEFRNEKPGNRKFIPPANQNMPFVYLNSQGGIEDTVTILHNGLKTSRVGIFYGVLNWGSQSLTHEIGSISAVMPSSKMIIDKSTIKIFGDTLNLSCQIFFDTTAVFDFVGNGIEQNLRCWQALPKILHNGNSSLKPIQDTLKCNAFIQNNGTLNLVASNLICNEDLIINGKSNSVIGLENKLIAANRIKFIGLTSDMINVNPTTQWKIKAFSSLFAQNAIISNCDASWGTTGSSVNCIDAGGNINWQFQDRTPPVNTISITSYAIDTTRIGVMLKYLSTNSVDHDSNLIVWSSLRAIDSVTDPAIEGSHFKGKYIYNDTIYNLIPSRTYYISAFARDTARNYSPIVLSAKAIVTIPSYFGPVWYVTQMTSGTNQNGSRNNPFDSIQKAISKARIGDTIKVTGGGYRIKQSVGSLNSNVTIIGGYAPDYTFTNSSKFPTHLFAENDSALFILGAQSGCVIKNLDFVGFKSTCILADSIGYFNVEGCKFLQDSTALVVSHGSQFTFKNNIVALGKNGIVLDKCKGTAQITNNTFTKLRGYSIHDQYSTVKASNNIFAYNSHAIFEVASSADTLVFNNFWENNKNLVIDNVIQPENYFVSTTTDKCQGILFVNPNFVDTSATVIDLRLKNYSQCIDAGDPLSDFSNEPMPNGGRIDLGAYGNTPLASSKDMKAPTQVFLSLKEQSSFTNLRSPGLLIQALEADSMRIALTLDTATSIWKRFASYDTLPIDKGGCGLKTIWLQTKDFANNRSGWQFIQVTYDTVKPQIVFTPNSIYGQNNLPKYLNGIVRDSLSPIREIVYSVQDGISQKFWNGQSWSETQVFLNASGTNDWSFPVPTLSTGKHSIYLASGDLAGNKTAIFPYQLAIDLESPKIVSLLSDTFNLLSWPGSIKGISIDSISGLDSILITLKNQTTNFYWDGSSWSASKTVLIPQLTRDWNYFINASAFSHGLYVVDIMNKDKAGNVSFFSDSFNFISEAPTAKILSSALTGAAPFTVSFIDSSIGIFTGRVWDFGDGIFDTIANSSHTYVNRGKYQVTLTSKGPGGSTTAKLLITVSDTTKPKPVTSLVITAQNASTAKISWQASLSKDIDSIRFCGSVAEFTIDPSKGAYQITVPANQSSALLQNLPRNGVLLFISSFTKDSSGNWSDYSSLSTGYVLMPDSTAPENKLSLIANSLGDSSIIINWKTGKEFTSDAAWILSAIQFGNPFTNHSNFQSYPCKDTTYKISNTTRQGWWYIGTILVDSSGNKSILRNDSVLIKNSAPVFTLSKDTSVFEDSLWSIILRGRDVNGDNLTFKLVSSTVGVSLTDSILTWIPKNENVGMNTIAIQCLDSRGGIVSDTIQILVINTNDKPFFNYSGESRIDQGKNFVGLLNIKDQDAGDSLSVKALKLPAWLILQNDKLTGIPGNKDVGKDSVIIICFDKQNMGDTLKIALEVLNVNDIPEIFAQVIPDSTLEDRNFTFTIHVKDIDINDSISIQSISFPTWLNLSDVKIDSATHFTYTGIPRDNHKGMNKFSCTFKDKFDGYIVFTDSIFVVDMNNPPNTMVTKQVNGGAVVYYINAIDDRDSNFTYDIQFTGKDNSKYNFSKSITQRQLPIYPLTDGSYYVSIRAKDSEGLIDSTPVLDTLTITGASHHVFADTGSWNMVGIPSLNYNADSLRGDGRLVHWDESKPEKYLYSYYIPSNEIRTLTSGNGYWRKSTQIAQIIIPDSLIVSGSQKIVLAKDKYGWNQIASPYVYPVNWNNKEILWKWNPTTRDFEEAGGILEPWQGYWVLTDSTKEIELSSVPVFKNGALAKKTRNQFQNKSNWNLQIELLSENGNDLENSFGFNKLADDQFDSYDKPEPPRMDNSPHIFFYHNDWIKGIEEFASDIRKTWQPINIYQVGISNNTPGKNSQLRIRGVDQLQGLYVFTIHNGNVQQITNDSSITVVGSAETQYKSVIVTDNLNFMKNFPVKFTMSNLNPNPASRLTRIKYSLPYQWTKNGMLQNNSYWVSIKIFDIKGRVVRELVSRRQPAGIYEIVWNGMGTSGRRTASGPYYCHLEAGQYKATTKILKLR